MRSGKRPCAFLDRDGVINVERGYVHRVEEFEFLPGAVEAIGRLCRLGFELVIVTNQAGIARGYYDEAQYLLLTAHVRALLEKEGVRLAGTYHCPHHPQGVIPQLAVNCACRKPLPGLLLRAAQELDLDISRSIIVGDKISDVQAGRAAGVAATYLVRSGCPLPDDLTGEAVFDDLLAVTVNIEKLGGPWDRY